mmetsp:Transcript_17430/g.24892  ORF Transcript_17430/g.24892 Transcript_17430/m.24892 type:complete len:638 (+) Transcript_17430:540-2453(+)
MKVNVKKHIEKFRAVKIAQILCVVYILPFCTQLLGLVDPETGNIMDMSSPTNTANGVIYVNGDYRPVVAMGKLQVACLVISRMSAFSLYPVMIAVFLSKCRATSSVLSKIHVSEFLMQDNHELHEYAGRYIAVVVWIHTFFHLLRWGLQGNIELLWTHKTGISGFVVVVATPIITVLMISDKCKRRIKYEIRKGLHYLFYVFAVGLCFHAPTSGIPNGGFIAPVLGFCIALYTLDALYVYVFMTEKIDTTIFHVLPSGVEMTMAVSESFQKRMNKGGIAYVCLPWVSKTQWHAFSLFEDPRNNRKKQVFMLKTGDWTTAVHDALQRKTVRPMWISGPFISPFNAAVLYDNQILVASGIGITPALSVINAHKELRRVNLIWACRDAAMLEFYIEHMIVNSDGWNLIFYTGKDSLDPAVDGMNTNVCILKGRPDLEAVIPNIIYGIESGEGLPEKYLESEREQVKRRLADKLLELEGRDDMRRSQKRLELNEVAQSQGYRLENHQTVLQQREGSKVVQKMKGSIYGNLANPLKEWKSDSESCGNSNNLFGPDNKCVVDTMNQSKHRNLINLRISLMLESGFKPWEHQIPASEFVSSLGKASVLNTWGVLYCGGSKPVEAALRCISREYQINLNTESFAW